MMRASILTALLALCAPCDGGGAAAADRSPQPWFSHSDSKPEPASSSGHFALTIEDMADGSCSIVSAGSGAGRRILADSCHGWKISDCGGMVLASVVNVRADTAKLFVRGALGTGGRPPEPIAVEAAIGRGVADKWGRGFEILHLQFGQPHCIEDGMLLPFTGSIIGKGVSGPAAPMEGLARFDGRGRGSVAFGPVPRNLLFD